MKPAKSPGPSETSARQRYEELCAKYDRVLLAQVMELDFRLCELERAAGETREYSISLTDHPGNLRLLDERLERLEGKLLPKVKPN
jgi:hypothetical protein